MQNDNPNIEGEHTMYKIYKTSLCSPIYYAAEELKKYLRMMMPECSEIDICYDPSAKNAEKPAGFVPGLMSRILSG